MDANENAQEEAGSPQEVEAYETLVAGIREHIFGKGEAAIRDKLRSSQSIEEDIGSMVLAMIMEGAKQASSQGIELDFDTIVSAGTEIIDDMFEIAEAMGVVDEVTDDMRSKALLSAVRAYLMSANISEEERAAAQQELQQMQIGGDVDSTASYLSEMGQREGVDPFAEAEQPPPARQRPSIMGA